MTIRKGGRAWRTDVAHFLATTTETHCWLLDWCGGAYVDRTLPSTHRWGATADHQVPLMLGGPELVRDGAVLHLAHNRCNAARSNRMRAQLAREGRLLVATLTPRTSRNW